MSDEKPSMQEKIGAAMHSGATGQRNPRATERADYVMASANAYKDPYGLYEHLGGLLIFLAAIHPDRPHDAPTVAEGPKQVAMRQEGDREIAVELERRRTHLRDRIAAEKEEAIDLLYRIARRDKVTKDFDDTAVRFFARLTFVEWYHRICSECRGSKYGTNETGVVVICPACHGSGVRRFSDQDRCEALGCDRTELRRWGRALSTLAGVMGEAIRAKERSVAKMINGW